MGVILFLLLFLVYRYSRVTCLLWMVVAYPTFSIFPISNGVNAISLMSLFLLFHHIYIYRNLKLKVYKLWLLIPTVIALISYVGSYIYTKDKHITNLLPYLSDMLLVYFMWYYKNEIKIKNFYRVVIIYSSFICIYGIYEGIIGYNPILTFLRSIKLYNAAEQRDNYIRFGFYRAQSLTIWCSIYGVVCAFSFFSLMYAYFNKLLKFNRLLFLLMFLLLWGVIISGTRTVIAMTLIGSLAFIPYVRGRNKYILSTFVILFMIAFFTEGYLHQVLEVMLGNEEVEGSSQEMRDAQLEAALTIYNGKLWGDGIGSMAGAIEDNPDLLGGESIVFSTLIERGTVGMICLIGYAVTSLFFLIKRNIYFLLFWVVAFYFAKYNSLIPGLREFYVLMYYLPIFNYENKK